MAERVTAYLGGVQERLRTAEIARAAEAARAEEAVHTAAEANERVRVERRARRFQVGLAASLLVLVTVGGLGATYLLQQRQQRAARFAQVLAEARALRDRAVREAGDPAAWRDALAALERAEGRGPEVEALRDEIQAGLDEAERGVRLRQELVEVRANQQDVGAEGTDAAYAAAFRDAGLDLDALEPDEFARRLGRQPAAVVIEVSAFLDDWSAVRREANRPVASWRKPMEAARLADPDPYRDRLRAILLAEDRRPQAEVLRALAAAPESAELPAPTAVLLGRTLAGVGQAEAAVALLRAAAGRHPGDVWVNYYLARALERLRPSAREEAVRYYTAARALRPETAHELAHLLGRMGRGAEAEAVFRDLADRRPENVRHLDCLATHLKESGRAADAAPILERAIIAARKAIRLRPDDAGAHYNLGAALAGQGKVDEAVAEYRTAIRLQPDDAQAHYNLGNALRPRGRWTRPSPNSAPPSGSSPTTPRPTTTSAPPWKARGRWDEAVAEYRTAIRLQPDDAGAHNNLGNALADQGKLDEAVAAYRTAIRLQPDDAGAHHNLGTALEGQGKVDEAVAEFRTAIRLQPDLAEAHSNLGTALMAQGKVDEAVAEFRTAIRLQPDNAEAHNSLGNALLDQGKVDEAVADIPHRHPAPARLRRGPLQPRQRPERPGEVPEAIDAYREAIRLKPDYAEAHCNLGLILRGQGDYAGSSRCTAGGTSWAPGRPGWRYPSAQWVADAERLAALAARLPALLKGEDRPKDVADRLALAQMCYDTKRHAAAARFWAEALAADPKLGDDRQAGHRYNAACAAALAGAGQGTDDPKPDDAARARLRGQALDWLKAERAAWAKVLDSSDPQARSLVQQTLQHWQADTDLAGVRDAGALAKLPEAERVAWRSLWADVDALLARSRRVGP